MKLTEATPEILRLVNNQNSSSYVFNWIKEALREVQRLGRWNWLIKSQIQAMNTTTKFLTLPTDCYEIIEPIYLNTAVAGTGSWAVPTAPWEFEKQNQLESQNGDFRISPFGIEFHSRWNTITGAVWLNYYRDIIIPTSSSDSAELDVPEEFAYPIIIYGAAKLGLRLEDDYDRMNDVRGAYDQAVKEMEAWDARRGSANGIIRAKEQRWMSVSGPVLPNNYAL